MIKSSSCTALSDSGGHSSARSRSASVPRQQPFLRSQSSLAVYQTTPRSRRETGQTRPVTPVAVLPNPWVELPLAFQNEIEMESLLHVTTFAAAQCEGQFGSVQLPAAPSVGGMETQSEALAQSQQQLRALAACLATPSEAAEENERETEVTARARAFQSSMRGTGTAVYQLHDEVTHCMDRWVNWVRRIRRKRRIDQFQAFIAKLSEAPSPFLSFMSFDEGGTEGAGSSTPDGGTAQEGSTEGEGHGHL